MPLAKRSFLLILLTFTVWTVAQPTTNPAPPPLARAAAIMQRFRNALQQLQLSTEQRLKVQRVLEDTRQRLADLLGDAQNDTSQLREKFQGIMQDTRQQLRSILTPEQQEKLRSLMMPGNRENEESRQPASAPSATTEPADHADTMLPLTEPLQIGQPAPDFVLKKLNNETVQLSSLKGKIVLLVFGSYSSPIFRQHVPALEQIKREYFPHINPFIIYTRESYPSGEWDVQRNKQEGISIAQPSDMQTRINQAMQAHDGLHLSVPILIDSMDNKTASDYSGFTNAAVLIGRDGKVLFYQKWFE
ncbi:MAG TPA: redoxin domain-containing protein, partial [Tepidisphaeraceae bacterium]|nr:redoxin domain-containing protein [Tepidisphaeraceae bacterium]